MPMNLTAGQREALLEVRRLLRKHPELAKNLFLDFLDNLKKDIEEQQAIVVTMTEKLGRLRDE